jgi:hypothetical protein
LAPFQDTGIMGDLAAMVANRCLADAASLASAAVLCS